MANKLTLTDIQKEELIEVYREKIKKLDQQKREYIDLISQKNGDIRPNYKTENPN